MRYLVTALSLLVISVTVIGIIKLCFFTVKPNKGEVRLPMFLGIIGDVVSGIFVSFALFANSDEAPLWVVFILLLFSLLGLVLVIAQLNCRIVYDDNSFTHTSFFGIKRKYSYEQVTAIKEDLHDDYVYIGKRKIMVDWLAYNGHWFVATVKKKYRTIHNGKAIPKVESKGDIFKGHVMEAGGFVFVYAMLAALSVGFVIFMSVQVYSPESEDTTVCYTTAFSSCEFIEDAWVLTSADREVYKISFYGENFNIDRINELCDGVTTVDVYCLDGDSDDSSYYPVRALFCGDEVVFGFDESNRAFQKSSLPVLIVFSLIALLVLAFIVMSIIVGRNPQKFSPKVVGIFFRDGYVIY